MAGPVLAAAPIRVSTWNLERFPNGSPKELPASEQDKRIAAAANVLRPLNPDIILLQEVRDCHVCASDFSLGTGYAQTAPAPAPKPATLNATPSYAPQFVTLTQPVKVKVPYGETTLPRGLKLPVLSRDAQTVTVRYLDSTYPIPLAATDLP
jgi:hypothetical protein